MNNIEQAYINGFIKAAGGFNSFSDALDKAVAASVGKFPESAATSAQPVEQLLHESAPFLKQQDQSAGIPNHVLSKLMDAKNSKFPASPTSLALEPAKQRGFSTASGMSNDTLRHNFAPSEEYLSGLKNVTPKPGLLERMLQYTKENPLKVGGGAAGAGAAGGTAAALMHQGAAPIVPPAASPAPSSGALDQVMQWAGKNKLPLGIGAGAGLAGLGYMATHPHKQDKHENQPVPA